MAKKPFAKQRPPHHNPSKKWLPEGVEVRMIGISIEGYDPQAITRAQEQQRAERRERLAKRAARQASGQKQPQPQPAPAPQQLGSSEEIEALAIAAGAKISEPDLEALQLAFNEQGGTHADA